MNYWAGGERETRRAVVDSHTNQQSPLSPSLITELSTLDLDSFQILHCRFSLLIKCVSEALLFCIPPQSYFVKNVGKIGS